MPVPLISEVFHVGLAQIPHISLIVKTIATITIITFLKRYFQGAQNPSTRVLHGKVIILTGGTSGIGASVAFDLASRGAQLVLLTQHPLSDPFLVDYIEDMRTATGNELITAECVDLADLFAVRKFATRWVDNAPPRRLDMVILCADERIPSGLFSNGAAGGAGQDGGFAKSMDGVERTWAVNYLANFHLASILSPAIRAQPPDRDVRVIMGVCGSYMGGDLSVFGAPAAASSQSTPPAKEKKAGKGSKKASAPAAITALQPPTTAYSPAKAYATSKLAVLTFAAAFQKHLTAYARPDGLPPNIHVVCVDPGWTRTPGMRRHLSLGSLWGLLAYVLTWPVWWLVLKSSNQGAQSFLWAAQDPAFGRIREEGSSPLEMVLLKECYVVRPMRSEVSDEAVQKKLWEGSERLIEMVEKEGAVRRAIEKKEREREDTVKAGSAEATGEKKTAEKTTGSRRSRKADSSKE